MGVVTGDQGDLRTETGKLSDRIHVQDQIFVDGDAPTLEGAGERIIIGNFGAAHF